MLMLERSFKSRVWQGQQRHFLELPDVRADPDTANSDYSKKVRGMQAGRASFALKRWNDEPVNVHKRQHNQPPGHDGKQAQASLHSALEQQQKRYRKVHHDQKYGQSSPSTECARDVPRDFIFQVAGPDDQELRKGHISP